MEVIPVIDLMNSIAVSGKSGERENYRPLQTVFANSPNPVEISLSLKRCGARRVYVADLDAIEGRGFNADIVQRINHVLPVMVDFGVKDLESFELGLDLAWQVIIATETLKDIEELKMILESYHPRAIVSIDTKNGQLYSKNLDISLEEFRDLVMKLDPQEIILLDLGAVGTKRGFNEELLGKFQDLKDKMIIGGGITSRDIPSLKSEGIKKILVGSALHQGEIPLYI